MFGNLVDDRRYAPSSKVDSSGGGAVSKKIDYKKNAF
jgi:hypothetical protein